MARSISAQRFVGCVLFGLFALVAFRSGTKAQEGPMPILDPQTVMSASGEFTLHIDPSDPYGIGSASYRLKRKDRVVWEGMRPFTLWEAAVTNEGTVGGYAYSYGPTGSKRDRKNYRDFGDLETVILDPTGRIRMDQKTKRVGSRMMHRSPSPLATGVMMDGAGDRLIVRVEDENANRNSETWWVYQLSTGREWKRFAPELQMERGATDYSLVTARAIAGTPLTLVHWLRSQAGASDRLGARFTLIDAQGKPVWHLDLPQDYVLSGKFERLYDLIQTLRTQNAQPSADSPGKFTLRFVTKKQQIAFAVAPATVGKWRVTELRRAPYVPPIARVPTFDAPSLQLALRDQIELRIPDVPTSPAPEKASEDALQHSIAEVAVFPDGRILAVDKDTYTVHVFDASGRWLHVCDPHAFGQDKPGRNYPFLNYIDLGPQDSFLTQGGWSYSPFLKRQSAVWFDADGKHQAEPAGFQLPAARIGPDARRPDGTWMQ
ncbi:MAG: hypothetical protein JWN14_1228, partial [Chthonomonadales bacterium]|nr:hypothetical protein [Chthonomonadales bacterium]